MPCYPVFCTAKIPADVLEELLTLRRAFTDEFGIIDNDLYFVTPTEIDNYAALRAIDTKQHGPPKQDLTDIQPFVDWTVRECYSFYRHWLQDPPDRTDGNFSAFTFLILDGETMTAGSKDNKNTVIVCTDAPDVTDLVKWGRHAEGKGKLEEVVEMKDNGGADEDKTTTTSTTEPILKFRRLWFEAAVQTIDTWETMTGMFSDLGQHEQLSFHARSWTRHVSYSEDGKTETREFLKPGEARANQERLLREYVAGKRHVDMTYGQDNVSE